MGVISMQSYRLKKSTFLLKKKMTTNLTLTCFNLTKKKIKYMI